MYKIADVKKICHVVVELIWRNLARCEVTTNAILDLSCDKP